MSKQPVYTSYWLLLLVSSIFLFPEMGKSQTARKYSNEFLAIGVDAAALGMSKAVVASTNSVHAAYWNPAGLTHITQKEVGLMHAEYFAGIANYDYAAFAMPIDEQSAFAVSIIRFGVDDILNTTQLIDANGVIDYNRISLFSAADYAFSMSYARKLTNGLAVGATSKIIRRIIGDFATSWGFGIDIGLQYQHNDWKLGLQLRDITTTFNTWAFDEDELASIQQALPNQNQEIPETNEITLPKAQLGVARTSRISDQFELAYELDVLLRFTQTNDIISSSVVSMTPALGLELAYDTLLFLRAGVGDFQQQVQFDGSENTTFQPNIGIGFQYKGFQLDYALTNMGSTENALYSNIFSLKIAW